MAASLLLACLRLQHAPQAHPVDIIIHRSHVRAVTKSDDPWLNAHRLPAIPII